MKYRATFTADANISARCHLLQHFDNDEVQEDLCFGLWRPSRGANLLTALIDEVILPASGDRILHRNASFQPGYLARSVRIALREEAGLVFMHSHPSPGWQGMSAADVKAERDVVAYPAAATGLPLLGLTIGSDGYWSGRFWRRANGKMEQLDCEAVRVVGPQAYSLYFDDRHLQPPPRKEILRRTFDTWGREAQNTISRLRIGIVGLGSVGCVVTEALARIGVTRFTLIDPDKVEEHNLDRLLYGTVRDIGKYKVDLAARMVKRHATADSVQIVKLPVSIHDKAAYMAALDCDLLFSCVDRPIPRDVLNYLANAHLIPVIDGGVAIEIDNDGRLFSAHWRSHLVTPYHRCPALSPAIHIQCGSNGVGWVTGRPILYPEPSQGQPSRAIRMCSRLVYLRPLWKSTS